MQNSSVITSKSKTAVAVPARELSWSFILLVLVCACVVATGFFFAARQHFTSMDYGIKNSKLREQLRNLEAEKRRLLLAREIASSPLAIRKVARGLGLQQSAELEPVMVAAQVEPKAKSVETQAERISTSTEQARTAPKVVRTVLTVPSQAKSGGETRSRVVEPQKEKKEKTEVAALLKLR